MKRIVLIDDNVCYNKISKLILSRLFADDQHVEIIGFTEPKEGLTYIISEYEHAPAETVIFLDINMPVLSGWDVLDALSRLPDNVKQYFVVYLLSSSIDPRDKYMAAINPMVKDYLEKPLSNHLELIRKGILQNSCGV